MGLFDLPHFSKLIQEALKKSPDQAGLQAEAPRLAKASAVLAKIRLSFVGYAGKLAACDMETLFHQAECYRDLTLLLLSPHNQVRQAVEALTLTPTLTLSRGVAFKPPAVPRDPSSEPSNPHPTRRSSQSELVWRPAVTPSSMWPS